MSWWGRPGGQKQGREGGASIIFPWPLVRGGGESRKFQGTEAPARKAQRAGAARGTAPTPTPGRRRLLRLAPNTATTVEPTRTWCGGCPHRSQSVHSPAWAARSLLTRALARDPLLQEASLDLPLHSQAWLCCSCSEAVGRPGGGTGGGVRALGNGLYWGAVRARSPVTAQSRPQSGWWPGLPCSGVGSWWCGP